MNVIVSSINFNRRRVLVIGKMVHNGKVTRFPYYVKPNIKTFFVDKQYKKYRYTNTVYISYRKKNILEVGSIISRRFFEFIRKHSKRRMSKYIYKMVASNDYFIVGTHQDALPEYDEGNYGKYRAIFLNGKPYCEYCPYISKCIYDEEGCALDVDMGNYELMRMIVLDILAVINRHKRRLFDWLDKGEE